MAARIAQETDSELICCESEQRTAVLVELARNLDLPYVPFKMVFVEGIVVLNFGGDCHKIKLPVLPAYIALGCYDNIFAYRKIVTKQDTLPASLAHLAEHHDLWKQGGERLAKCTAQASPYQAKKFWPDDDDMFYETFHGDIGSAAMLGLRVALDPVHAQAQMFDLIFEEHVQINNYSAIYLPDGYGDGPTIEWQCSVADGSFATFSDEALQTQLREASLASVQGPRGASTPVITLRAGDAAFCADEASKVRAALYDQQKCETEEARATLQNGRAVLQMCANLFKNEDHSSTNAPPFKFDVALGSGRDRALRRHILDEVKAKVEKELGFSMGKDYSRQWLLAELLALRHRYHDAFGSEEEYSNNHKYFSNAQAEAKAAAAEKRVTIAAAVAAQFEERANGDVVLPKQMQELLEQGEPPEPEPMQEIEYKLYRWRNSNEALMRVACLKHCEWCRECPGRCFKGCRVFDTKRSLQGVAKCPDVASASVAPATDAVAATASSSPAEEAVNATEDTVGTKRKLQTVESAPPLPAAPVVSSEESDILRTSSSAPRLFHLDAYGKTCFSEAEAEQASDRIVQMRLDERVKACLQRKRFLLPQQNRAFNAHFCNESVYGTVNLLCVSGVVRMEQAEAVTPSSVSQADAVFDAWPPPEVLADKRHRDFETKPREWMDEGDESDPENAPGYNSNDNE